MLIMRDALHGLTRFDEFQASLGIAPNMLTRRLNSLVEAGLLERSPYSEHPPRYEYLPTARGRDFFPVLVALLNFGNKHFASDGKRVVIADRKTGVRVDPVMVDATTGQPIVDPTYALAAGPAANRRIKQRYAATAGARQPNRMVARSVPPASNAPKSTRK